jgi:hypothetical protein
MIGRLRRQSQHACGNESELATSPLGGKDIRPLAASLACSALGQPSDVSPGGAQPDKPALPILGADRVSMSVKVQFGAALPLALWTVAGVRSSPPRGVWQ